MIEIIQPNWPAPANVHAFTTTRKGGVSKPPYTHLNLATHVNDNEADVATNRALLYKQFSLPCEPVWLNQVHGIKVIRAGFYLTPPTADASYTTQQNCVCAVLTADCLPLLICNQQGTQVAAIHAGWRGLAAGIIEQTLASFAQAKDELLVWLGPAISQQAFEVGNEVHEQFLAIDTQAEQAFILSARPHHWLADIYQLAKQRLQSIGIKAIYGGEYCTYQQPELFYSYRRDGALSGRMASLIWICN